MTVIRAEAVFAAKVAYDEMRRRKPRSIGKGKKRRKAPWTYDDEIDVQRARIVLRVLVGKAAA